MKKEGPFCNISEQKTKIIDETENTLTILSNPALVKGHCLVIPKRHIESLSELNDKEREEFFSQVIKMQELLLKEFSGCDIRQNFRPFQKQNGLKINRLHIHIQPREFEDELYQKCQIFEKELFKQLSEKELNKLIESLRKNDRQD